MSAIVRVVFAGQEVSVRSNTLDLLPLCRIMFGHHASLATQASENNVTLEYVDDAYTIVSETRFGDADRKTLHALGLAMVELRDRIQYLIAKDQSDYLIVHAGAAIYDGKTYVYPAASGSGKTTLSAWFIGQGATLLSDELIAVSPDGMVSGYAQTLNLKRGGEAPFYEALGLSEDEVACIKQPNGNAFVKWEAQAEPNSWHRLNSFLLPSYDRDCDETAVVAASPARVAASLLENTINLRNFDRMGFSIIKSLSNTTDGHQAIYKKLTNSIFKRPICPTPVTSA